MIQQARPPLRGAFSHLVPPYVEENAEKLSALHVEQKLKTLPKLSTENLLEEALERIFCFPIIQHPGWNMVEKEQEAMIRLERFKQVMGNQEGEVATDYEVMMYMSSCSMIAPLDHDAYRAYACLFAKFYPKQAKEIFQNECLEVQPDEERLITRLKADIYKSQVKAWKQAKKERVKRESEKIEHKSENTQN